MSDVYRDNLKELMAYAAKGFAVLAAVRAKLDASLSPGGMATDDINITMTKEDAAMLIALIDSAMD